MDNKELLEDREYGYRLLKLIFFVEPTYEFIDTMIDSFEKYNYDIFFTFMNNYIKEELAKLNNEFSEVSDIKSYAKELLWEYNRLFVGPKLVEAPPWKSFYFNNQRLIFQEETAEIKNYFRKHGYRIGTESVEAEDHIGFMLDFMEKLSSKLNDSNLTKVNYLEYLKDQYYFIENHLLTWIEKFAKKINENANYIFYKVFSNIMVEFIKIDGNNIKELLEKEV